MLKVADYKWFGMVLIPWTQKECFVSFAWDAEFESIQTVDKLKCLCGHGEFLGDQFIGNLGVLIINPCRYEKNNFHFRDLNGQVMNYPYDYSSQ